MSFLGYISREESDRKLQESATKLAQVQEENAKLGERLKKLSVSFENILCKLCESPLDIEVWKYINRHLSKEDTIVC